MKTARIWSESVFRFEYAKHLRAIVKGIDKKPPSTPPRREGITSTIYQYFILCRQPLSFHASSHIPNYTFHTFHIQLFS
ncbi:hypothetical protein HMPREF0971_01963 [Segatella oris F0302]|uniref:Uncharacterized protein n=1 Tax=Segatella oris F0302 TaxID=649760 RepID=D1QSK4_9BACT|nr:hypothetical protein HMPREF0971_01963 [Segatella oris F0302]